MADVFFGGEYTEDRTAERELEEDEKKESFLEKEALAKAEKEERAAILKRELLKEAEVAARTHAAELEEIELLEHRYHALVDMKRRTTSIWSCCYILWEVIRSIPWLSIVAVIPSIFGAVRCWENKGAIQAAIIDIDMTSNYYADYFLRYLSVFLIVLIIVDCVTVVAAFGAQGATREYIFGHTGNGCMYCLQVVAGRLTFSLLFLLLMFYVLSLFLVEVFVALPGYAFFQIAVVACQLGEPGMNALVAAGVGMENLVDPKFNNFHVDGASFSQSLNGFCNRAAGSHSDTIEAFRLFCFGMFVNLIGQVTQLTLHAANLESILAARGFDAQKEQEDIKLYYETHRYGTTEV